MHKHLQVPAHSLWSALEGLHATVRHGLKVACCTANDQCRYSKNDEQLCKTVEQLMEGIVDYFVWQTKHKPAVEVIELCFRKFLMFVDDMAMYFTGTGLPTKISQSVMKILKLQSVETRSKVCEAFSWKAHSMQGSSSMWISASPALRAALEGTGADPEQGGRRKRARV